MEEIMLERRILEARAKKQYIKVFLLKRKLKKLKRRILNG
jgi:hypothetical protein